MTSDSKDDLGMAPSNVDLPTADTAHAGQGAPTDQAHQSAGDGTLTGWPNGQQSNSD